MQFKTKFEKNPPGWKFPQLIKFSFKKKKEKLFVKVPDVWHLDIGYKNWAIESLTQDLWIRSIAE